MQKKLPQILKTTIALCFIGHGAWGLIGKAAWVPFYTCLGIPESWAWRSMPLVGAMDVAFGLLLLLRPCRLLLLWMSAWCVWTALLRPLSGATMWEVWERGGNYGPPIVLLILCGGFAATREDLLRRLDSSSVDARSLPAAELLLRLFLALLLFGHAGFGVFVRKDVFLRHYASVGLPAAQWLVVAVGWFEMLLAALVLIKPRYWIALLWFILAWKLSTEFLYVTSGPWLDVFEWIERWGDYGIPAALLLLALSREMKPLTIVP